MRMPEAGGGDALSRNRYADNLRVDEADRCARCGWDRPT